MSKVLVDRELLESLAELGEDAINRMGSYLAEKHGEQRYVDAARAILALPAEAEGVEAVEFWVLFDATTPEQYIKKMMPEGFLAFFDHEDDAIRAKSFHPGTDYERVSYVRQSAHLDALSAERTRADVAAADANDAERALAAVTAERDRLLDQVKVLQSDANSWQSGYDKGRHDGTKHRQIEVDRLRAEVEAMRKVIRAALYYIPEHKLNLREIMSAAMAAKEE